MLPFVTNTARVCASTLILGLLCACADEEPVPDTGDVVTNDADPDGAPGDADGSGAADTTADPDTSFDTECFVEATWESVGPVFAEWCVGCHSAELTGLARGGAPEGVDFDTEEDVRRLRDLVRLRVVETETMPPTGPLSDCDIARVEALLDAMDAAACEPVCGDRECGDDGCGGTCGECGGALVCALAVGECVEVVCEPACDGLECGNDGCGGTCGACDDGEECSDAGTCACVPSCEGRECGGDGCGGSCGSCGGPDVCTDAGVCECVPECAGRECGPDGCGGDCGACGDGSVCNTVSGACGDTCEPSCIGRECGDDGCGGSCGVCTDGVCDDGTCACAADCLGRSCGDDGCGGTCGFCGPGSACSDAGECVCAPSCIGRECGDDGCGGSCGACGAPDTCDAGACVEPIGFAETVWPIFQAAGCTASSGCHGSVVPAAGLDFRTRASAYASLVDQPSDQCGGLTRVVPGAPESSYLINKLAGVGMCFGSQMPKTDDPLADATIDTIRAWIRHGAEP